MRNFALLAGLVTSLAFGLAVADTAILPASRDATLYEPVVGPMPPYPANGAGDYIFAGRTRQEFNRRAIVAFDIAGAIPAGATIDSVELTLRVSRTAGPANPYTHSLHRVTADWGEGATDADGEEGMGEAPPEANDTTWVHRFYDGIFWTASGGDYIAGASASILVAGEGDYTWGSTAGMVADVQQWLDTPASNFGWIIIGDESVRKTAKRFNSRENTDPGSPELVVNYTPVEETGSCCTGEMCQVVTAAQCTMLGGDFGGVGTSCSPNPCVDPLGACCANNGNCTESTQSVCEAGMGIFQGPGTTCQPLLCPVNLTPWLDALPLPAVATPVSGSAGGMATYDLAIRETTQQLHSELPSSTVWGYDDGTGTTYPGPTIEAASNQQVTVNWINDLRETGSGILRTDHYLDVDTACIHGAVDLPKTVVHLHGGHVEARYDGYPESTFLPGEMDTYLYPNDQQAGPLWYHDHALGITRLNVYMGLAGLYTVRDAVESALNLPAGEFEVPLVLQDRYFNPDGSLYYPSTWVEHFFGDKAVVNGKVWPYLNVTPGKYRFRLVNGSGSRTYTLSLQPPTGTLDFTVIGNEGGLLEAPVAGVSTLTMGPGERYDVVVDFQAYAPGDEVVLENSAPAPFPNGSVDLPQIIKFIVVAGTAHTDPLPGSLRPVIPLDPGDAVIERDFVLAKADDDGCGRSNWLINGLGWDDITEYPELGTVEIWRFINDSGAAHPMHMHLEFFQVLDRQEFMVGGGGEIIPVGDPEPPPPWEAGWKDTAIVYPGQMLRVITRFEDYAGRFAYHCHILEHEDHEMMRQFQTIVPGCTVMGEEGEFCDGIDNDCNGIIDDGCSTFAIQKEISVDGGTNWFDADDAGSAPKVDFPSGADYRITVSNSGPFDMANVVVNDVTLGIGNFPIGDLAGGAQEVLTSAQIPALSVSERCTTAGTFENIATADGESAMMGTPAPQASDPANLVCVAPPSLEIVKEISVDGGANWIDANDAGSAPMVDFPSGADYRLTVSNPGPTDLVNVVVNDATLGITNYVVGDLAAGADMTLTSAQIPALSVNERCTTAGTFQNTATADGESAHTGTSAPQATDPANLVCVAPPSLEIVKEISVDGGTNWFDANNAGSAPAVDFPSGADYRLTVNNPGPTDLVNVVVNDTALGIMNFMAGNLAAGADMILTSMQIPALSVSERCTAAGTFENTATADAESAHTGTAAPQATDPANLVCVAPPALQIVKEISVDGGLNWFDANDAISAPIVDYPSAADYRLTVSNPGPTDLVNVTVSDVTLGITDHPAGSIASGANEVLTSTQIPALSVSERCTTAGTYENTATADGESAITGSAAPQAADPANLVCVEQPYFIDGFENLTIQR